MDVVKLATTVLECYSAWAGAAPTDLIVSEISGGLTNLIYLVKLEPKVHATMPKKPPTQVLLRLFGASTDGLINRDNELVCLDIAAGLGLGPRVLAQFKGGRVEEFIENARTWSVVDLRDPTRAAAAMKAMAMLHAAPLPADRFPAGTPALPKNLRLWAATAEAAAKQLIAAGGRKGLLTAAINVPSLVSVEVDWMLAFLQQLNSPVVFCHNDLQEGNLMEVAGGAGEGIVGKAAGPLGEVKVVDYEYGGYNYRGFDWGNFFCEIACDNFVEHYPGFCLNPDKYPSDEQQKVLLQAYLGGRAAAAGEVEAMMVEANSFAMDIS